MKVFIALLATVACCLAAAIPEELAIVPYHESLPQAGEKDSIAYVFNGSPASANQFPYQAGLRIVGQSGGASVCGGSLISASWVLSAAHCTVSAANVVVRLGSLNFNTGGVAQTSFRVINHPSFNPINLNNDISLVALPSPVSFSAAIQPVRLPTAGQASATFAGLQTTVSGWGGVVNGGPAQTLLRWANLRVIPNAQCAQTYGTSSVVPHVLCTVGYSGLGGVCGGDSGGPLVLNEGGVPTQVGVVAFAAHPNIGGCSSPAGHPSGYMRTASFLPWINQHTGVAIR